MNRDWRVFVPVMDCDYLCKCVLIVLRCRYASRSPMAAPAGDRRAWAWSRGFSSSAALFRVVRSDEQLPGCSGRSGLRAAGVATCGLSGRLPARQQPRPHRHVQLQRRLRAGCQPAALRLPSYRGTVFHLNEF